MTRIQALFSATSAAALFILSPAHAQMSVTTFGATDATACYHDAADDFSSSTDACDAALRSGLSRTDRKKTFVNRGIIHNRNGALQSAVDDFNAALSIDGSLAEAFLNRGNSYFLAGQNDAAIGDYEQSLTLGVSKPWAAHYNIGLAYDAKKDGAKAREAYEKALEVNPSFTPAQLKLAARS